MREKQRGHFTNRKQNRGHIGALRQNLAHCADVPFFSIIMFGGDCELMGVRRAQVSRIEKGHNLTIGTIVRAFRAMGVPATFLSKGYLYLFAEK